MVLLVLLCSRTRYASISIALPCLMNCDGLVYSVPQSLFCIKQWPKSGTPDRPIAVIGYLLNTQSHNDSDRRHLIGRNHIASERSRMSIGCTRLWLNKSSKCTRLAYKPPDNGRATRPPAHTHTRTRSRRELAPCHEAGHCLLMYILAHVALCC